MEASQHPLEAMIAGIEPRAASNPAGSKTVDIKPEKPGSIEITDHYINLPVTVNLSGIHDPALLLRADLKVVWQNRKAVAQIWHNAGSAHNGTQQPAIFDLLFDTVFKRQISNHLNSLVFFMRQLTTLLTEDQLSDHLNKMNSERREIVASLLEKMNVGNAGDEIAAMSDCCLHQRLRSGEERFFEVVATDFDEGRLLVFRSMPQGIRSHDRDVVKSVQQRIAHLKRQPNPTRIPYALLAARLNKAAALRIEMLSDEYWRLIHEISHRSMQVIESHHGIFGRQLDCGFFAYFLPNTEACVNPLQVIACSLELKAQMEDFGREWKIRKDWLHDIELNIGVHWEEDFVGALPSSTGDSITSFGPGLSIATAISRLAENGQVWATKALINMIPSIKYPRLRFGIQRPDSRRHEAFIRHGFTRIKDAFAAKHAMLFDEEALGNIPVTQVFDMTGSSD